MPRESLEQLIILNSSSFLDIYCGHWHICTSKALETRVYLFVKISDFGLKALFHHPQLCVNLTCKLIPQRCNLKAPILISS